MPETLAKPGGRPLPPELRMKLESAFGEDLSAVRVHTNASQAIHVQARAFVEGDSIYFAPGAYRPASPEGKRLLAHEVAHVLQQRKGVVSGLNESPSTRQIRQQVERALLKL